MDSLQDYQIQSACRNSLIKKWLAVADCQPASHSIQGSCRLSWMELEVLRKAANPNLHSEAAICSRLNQSKTVSI